MDLYKILEVRKNASPKSIKKAYHEKVLKYHPDKNQNTDIKKFHEIQTAYEILIDEEKRNKYDNLNKDDSFNISQIFSKLISKIDSISSFNKIKVQFTNILNNPKNIVNIMNLISKENLSFDDILDILSNLKTNNVLSTETEGNYKDIEDSEYSQEIQKLKYNTGDWAYRGFAELSDEVGFDMDSYDDHYDSDEEDQINSDYAKAMDEVIHLLKQSDFFNSIKKTLDFSIRRVEHTY